MLPGDLNKSSGTILNSEGVARALNKEIQMASFTVEQIIEKLSKMNPKTPVFLETGGEYVDFADVVEEKLVKRGMTLIERHHSQPGEVDAVIFFPAGGPPGVIARPGDESWRPTTSL